MRVPDLAVIENGAAIVPEDIALEIYRRICRTRTFEEGLIKAVKDGFVTSPVYLSSGQESIAAALSVAVPGPVIFAQHRCHGVYLSYGGDPVKLRDELMGLPTGTSGGRAGSNCIQCHENGVVMHGHHGLIGENVPIAVGYALASKKSTLAIFGDGAAEEDYVLSSLGFAATHRLPVLFVCEDNNLSILTAVETRRSWKVSKVAAAFGMEAVDLSDDPWTIFLKAKELVKKTPALMNIHTCRANWHVGIGTDGPVEWDRFLDVRNALKATGLWDKAQKIEDAERFCMEKVWEQGQLRRLSGK